MSKHYLSSLGTFYMLNNTGWVTYTANLKLGTVTSLVVRWIRIRLPVQGTCVQSLVQEDFTSLGTTKSIHHDYQACLLQLLKAERLEPVLSKKRSYAPKQRVPSCSPQVGKACTQQWQPSAAKKMWNSFFLLDSQTISCMENGMWLRQQNLCW